MPEKKRARRRRDIERMKSRMQRLMRTIYSYRIEYLTPKAMGRMASTHGKPCSGSCCGNRRRFEGASISERRRAFGHEDLL